MPTRLISAIRRSAEPRGRRPSWADGLLALLLLTPALVHQQRGVAGVVTSVVMVVPLLWRRRAPVEVFAAIWLTAAVQGLIAGPTFTLCALLVAFYTVAATQPRRSTLLAGLALLVGIAAATSQQASGADEWLQDFVALTGLATAAGVLGINVGNRRQILAGLRERAERLEREREQEVALATANERGRIAREMHDVVAHNLSVMVALCDGAAYHVHDAPDRVASALEQASRTGRQALAEMRQLLGVLRDPPAGPELAPQPGVRQIEDLLEQIRAAGVPVTYSVTGELDGVAPGLELSVYRIVQEALTNTLKHAGPGVSARVNLICSAESVEIEVSDDGIGRAGPPRPGAAGLRGMRERAAVYGGTLEAGPCEGGGGWRVRASLSIPSTTPGRSAVTGAGQAR